MDAIESVAAGPRAHGDAPRAGDALDRIHGIRDQIEQDLLKMDTVAEGRGQFPGYVDIGTRIRAYDRISAYDSHDLPNDVLHGERLYVDAAPLEHRPQAFDHGCRALAVLADVVQNGLHLVDIRRLVARKSSAASALRRMAPRG